MSALTRTESDRLASLEQVVERGLETFVEVGEALREIRNSRLYRTNFDTFEDYCRERWGMSRSYAHRTIQASEIAAGLPNVDRPRTESQARELRPLRDRPDEMGAVMREAAAHGEPTARKVREAVERRLTDHQTNSSPSTAGNSSSPRSERPAQPEAVPAARPHSGSASATRPPGERVAAACDFIRESGAEASIEADPERWLRRLLGARQAIDRLIERAQAARGDEALSAEALEEERAFAERAGIEIGA